MPQAHGTHDQDQDRHPGEEDSIQERADDLGTIVGEGAANIGGPSGDPGRDESENDAAHCREGMEGVEMTAMEPE
jgi:hypothetical protein